MRISAIGVGVMGEPIAHNLQKAGMAVTAYCRTPATRRGFEGSGIAAADSATQAIAASDMVIRLEPGAREVDQVLERGAAGRIAVNLRERTLILMATVAPSYSQALAVLASASDESWIGDAIGIVKALRNNEVS